MITFALIMEETIGCLLHNVLSDNVLPSCFLTKGHVHIVVRQGEMSFFDGKHTHYAHVDDLVIWQMSNTISKVTFTEDFDADFLVVSRDFLQEFNPEMVWASKGFIFIKINPVFHLDGANRQLIESDFSLFRMRMHCSDELFKREILGRVMQIFLCDLWTTYRQQMSKQEANDNASRIFLRYLALVQEHCRCNRDVAYYADKLCLTPKYLSQVSKLVTGLPASEWISFYSTFELVTLLNDQSRTLTEVADMMNFETLSHFSRYCKKLLKKTPTEYRKT